MAYTGVSIVDYLKSVGQPSDYSSRVILAQQKGIQNYTGTAAQNTQLLNILNVPAPTFPVTSPVTAPITPQITQPYIQSPTNLYASIPNPNYVAPVSAPISTPSQISYNLPPISGIINLINPSTGAMVSIKTEEYSSYFKNLYASQGFIPRVTQTPISAPSYTGVSIVDYLKSVGQASDFTSRSQLAQQYGISGYAGSAEQNTQLLNLLKSGVKPVITPQVQALATPIPAPTITATPPTLPTPTALPIIDTYAQSMQVKMEADRKAVEAAYQKQLDILKTQSEAAQAKIDELTAQQKAMIETDVQPLMQPFRETLEKTERERLKVEENFFANQTLTNELGTLLTDIQADIQREKGITGLAAIREPRIAKVKEDALGRVGVIEAVMAARNNQITVANNLIDRSITAITADRTDKLNYYNTLLNFYEKQRTEEGAKLLSITTEQKIWLKAQVGLLEKDLASSQASVDYVKKLLSDPATALLAGEAGLRVNMTPQEMDTALADAVYQKDKREYIKTMALDEKVNISAEEARLKPTNEVSIVPDARGNNMYFWKKATTPVPISPTGANYNTRLNAEITALYGGRYGIEGAREKVINILQNEFPNVDVAGDVYNRVPDNWEKIKTTTTGISGALNYEDL